jgi:hypothetical protein
MKKIEENDTEKIIDNLKLMFLSIFTESDGEVISEVDKRTQDYYVDNFYYFIWSLFRRPPID